MKKILSLFLIICISLFSGCGNDEKIPEDSNNSTAPSSEINSDIIIPDPANTTGTAIVRIPQGQFYADLSFLGFKNKVQVEAFTSDREKNNRGKAIKLNGENEVANKIVLAIVATKDENDDIANDLHRDIESIQGYLAVLDYKSHSSYVTKVNVLPNDMAVKYVEQSSYQSDNNCVIVYRNWYKYRETEVYKFFAEENEYRNIYSNFTGEGNNIELNDFYFSGYLIDDYKAVVECKLLGFSKTVSLLDAGLKKEDLELKYAVKEGEPEPDDYYITRYFRSYRNGKWIGEKYTDMIVWSPEFEDYQDVDCLKFKYQFSLNKYYNLGYANIYFKYNSETQKLEPVGASFEMELF